LLLKYKALVGRSEQRLQSGLRRLTAERRRLAGIRDQCSRLQGEIEVQQQLAKAGELAGMALDRQQLFGWLRRNAADRRRSQALRLELRQQQENGTECEQKIGVEQVLCRRLEDRLERYRKLLAAERRKLRLRQFEIEECELEERMSWSK